MGDWKFNIGDIISDGRRNLTITNREIRYLSKQKRPCNQKWCQYTCNVCGWTEGWISEKALCEGKGCSCCHGVVIVKGINDIATKAPYVIPYLVDPEDAYRYTVFSNKKVKTKCPVCGEQRDYRIVQLTTSPYVCRRCGSASSLPEKFFYEFLKMYNIDFISQLSSAQKKWCGKYRYDFYIPSVNTIIELHGKQHYNKGIYNRTYEEIHAIDDKKIKLAFDNGIDNYCIIPFVRSEKKEMIEALINHEVIELLGIDKSNLKDNLGKCFEKIYKSRLIPVCDYYNHNPDLSAKDIGKKLGISAPTVLKALHYGNEYGLCNYDGQKKLEKVRNTNNSAVSKAVIITDLTGCEHKFKSIREASRQSLQLFGIHFSRFFIMKHIRNGKALNGYMFRGTN